MRHELLTPKGSFFPLKYSSTVKSKLSSKRNDSRCRTAKQKRSTSQRKRRDVTETNGETRNHNQSTGSPKHNAVASTHALEYIHGVYSLEPMNSYHLFAANSFLKIHKWQWPSLRKTPNLLLRKPNVLIIVTGVPE